MARGVIPLSRLATRFGLIELSDSSCHIDLEVRLYRRPQADNAVD